MALTKVRGYTQILQGGITDKEIATPSGVGGDTGIRLSKIQDSTLLLKSDGSVAATAPITGVIPTDTNHLATKGYVDNLAQGLDVKASVRAVATTNVTMSGPQVVDGVATTPGDRVLLAGQTNQTQNGIYVVATGAWSRAIDASTNASVTPGLFTFIEEGTVSAATGWVLASTGPTTLGTTSLPFTQFSSAGWIAAGNGLVKNGASLSVLSANQAISVTASGVGVALDGGTLSITSAGLKLADLPAGQILIGSATNIPTAKALSGDVTINSSGTVRLVDGSVTPAKMASIPAGKILIGTSSGVNTPVTLSGDVTITEAGVVTINPDLVVKLSDTVVREIPSGAINGVNVVYTLSAIPRAGKETVYVNGILQDPGINNDYTIAGPVITMLYTLIAGDKICVSYFK